MEIRLRHTCRMIQIRTMLLTNCDIFCGFLITCSSMAWIFSESTRYKKRKYQVSNIYVVPISFYDNNIVQYSTATAAPLEVSLLRSWPVVSLQRRYTAACQRTHKYIWNIYIYVNVCAIMSYLYFSLIITYNFSMHNRMELYISAKRTLFFENDCYSSKKRPDRYVFE